MNSEISHIQKYNGENFQIWKFQMQIIFEAKEMFDIVRGTERCPAADNPNFKEWTKKNNIAKMIITMALETKYIQQIINCRTAADIWSKLICIHEVKSEANVHILQQKFYECKMSKTDDVATYLSKIEMQAQQLRDLGEQISENTIITKILYGLPEEHKNFITAWDSVARNERTIENLTLRLLKEESILNHWEENNNKSENHGALFSKSKNLDCKTKSDFQKYANKPSIMDKKKITNCGYCGKKGHWWKECHKRLNEKKNKSYGNFANSEESYAFVIGPERDIKLEDTWYADSGATEHMTYKKEWFKELKEIPYGKHPVSLGNNQIVYALGKGNIDIYSFVNNEQISAMLKEVLYVPDLKKNLFSIGQAANNGLTIMYYNNQCKMSLNNKILIKGIRDNSKLYKLFIEVRTESQANVTYANLGVWHQRLCHVNLDTVKQMIENGMIGSSKENLTDMKNEKFFCEACIYGKQTRKPFKKVDSSKATMVGEHIFSDVCGPMNTKTPGGSKYYVVFKDEFSRYRTVYFLKNKSNVLEKFKEFVQKVRTETGHEIKRLRTDNGTEYVNKEFSDYLKQKGIIHELTAPYTPEQNGFSERDHRTLVESARSMLHARNLPLELWAEAINTSAYVLNRCISKQLNNISPYEAWYNKKPTLNHLRIFGSDAYVHVPKEQRRKFDKKSNHTLLVGYTETSKNYKLWNPHKRKMITSRNVIFNEISEKESI